MSTTLIAVVVALVLGHLAPAFAAAVRQYAWFGRWLGWLDEHAGASGLWRGRWGVALALLPPLLVVLFFQFSLRGTPLGLAGFVFAIAVLFYAWGPRDLDRDVGAVLDAADGTSRREAAARLCEPTPVRLDAMGLVDAVFASALRRWFGVLFWFLVLGPVGALLYRLAVLAAIGEFAPRLPQSTARGARTLLAALDWPVAQLMALSLALVGNFDAVLGAWRSAGGALFSLDHRFLAAVGRASVRSELATEAEDFAGDAGLAGEAEAPAAAAFGGLADLPELRDAMSLVWRCLLVWLAALALFVIAGWVS